MELISHHQPEEFWKGREETLPVHPLPRIPLASIHLVWAMRAPAGKTELEWLAKDHPETNPITIKPETVSHAAEQFSRVPTYCSPPGCPFPIKSLALSACVSSDNSFPSVRQEPSFGPWKGSPFLQHNHLILCHPLLVLPSTYPSFRVLVIWFSFLFSSP